LIVNNVPKLYVGLVCFVSLGTRRVHRCSWIGQTERIPKPGGITFPDVRFYRFPEILTYSTSSISFFIIKLSTMQLLANNAKIETFLANTE
jgi:hypothetical protein